MKLSRIFISSLLIAAFTASTGCNSEFFAKKSQEPATGAKQMVYAPELDPEVHELVTDQRFKSLESDEPVRFETAVTPEEAESGTPVELRDSSGKTLSKMYDDGTHSDRIAGDNIYTCSYKPDAGSEASYSYTAKIGSTETSPTSVRYFDKITDQDFTDMEDISRSFTDIQAKYFDSDGEIRGEKKGEAIDRMGEYAEQLCSEGKAVECRINKKYNNVVVKLSSGITCMYSLPDKHSAGGSGKPSNEPTTINSVPRNYAVKRITVNVFQPFYGAFVDTNGDPINSQDDAAAQAICNEFPDDVHIGISKKREEITYDSIRNFGKNQVIIWDGHGDYDPNLHSVILTSITYNEDDFTDTELISDEKILDICINDNNGAGLSQARIVVAFTSKYIDAHCPDLTNSFLFLGTCYGARDSVLATSFINKNCNIVLGFTDSTLTEYIQRILTGVINQMCTKRPMLTGYPYDYYSIDESLNQMKAAIGKTDYIFANTCSNYHQSAVNAYEDGFYDEIYDYNVVNPEDEPTPSEPILFGNRNYRFAEVITDSLSSPAAPAVNATGSLQLSEEIIHLDPGETKGLTVSSTPSGYTALNWSINDTNIATVDSNGQVTGHNSGTTWGHVETDDGLYYKYFTVVVD